MTLHFMPVRGERSAPIFDPTQPSTLRQYFAQLETHFARCTITSELEKKEFATSFLSWKIAEQWEALPEYSDTSKSYKNLKDRLLDLYNQSELRYTIGNLEELICYYRRLDLRSRQALTEFHLRFNEISMHLLKLDLLSPLEQSKMYLQAFDTSLRSRVELRLQIQFPACSLSHAHRLTRFSRLLDGYYKTQSLQNSVADISSDFFSSRFAFEANSRQCKCDPSDPILSTTLFSPSSRIPVRKRIQAIEQEISSLKAQCANTNTQTAPIRCAMLSMAISSPSPPLRNVSTASTVRSTPKTPLEDQMRIKEIEDELHILRAHHDISTMLPLSIDLQHILKLFRALRHLRNIRPLRPLQVTRTAFRAPQTILQAL
jgi:hypothetical protein